MASKLSNDIYIYRDAIIYGRNFNVTQSKGQSILLHKTMST